MRNYFYKLNDKYIKSFLNNVNNRFMASNKRTDVILLRSIFREINELFRKIGGRISDKSNIPQKNEYPDSRKFNELVTDISHDLDKLYTAQRLIEDDVQNVLNYNSIQRTEIFEDLLSSQQKILSLFIKNKKHLKGQETITESFQDKLSIGEGSSNVRVINGVLTLNAETNIVKPIDTNGVRMFFSGKKHIINLYPNANILALGSHWKIEKMPDVHFLDPKNSSEIKEYRYLMIDDPDNNQGVGSCRFQSVKTILKGNIYDIAHEGSRIGISSLEKLLPNLRTYGKDIDLEAIKEVISKTTGISKNFLNIDLSNSLQIQYSDHKDIQIRDDQKYKLVIPFVSPPITNEINIKFEPSPKNIYPTIDWNESKVYSNTEGAESIYNLIPGKETTKNGEYSCRIVNHVVPSRLELIVFYGDDVWNNFGYYMAHYQYNKSKTYALPSNDGNTVNLDLHKVYDVFVDAEPNNEDERKRAKNVLLRRE